MVFTFAVAVAKKLWLLKGNGCFLLGVVVTVCCVLLFFVSKRKEPKEKEIFCQSLR
jgi:hypothetical protein